MSLEDVEYFDAKYAMAPYGENGVLFTCEYGILNSIAPRNLIDNSNLVVAAITAIQAGPTSFKVGNDPFSHDNMTGIVCASRILGLNYHKTYFYSDWWHRAHPRDVIFYLACLNPIMRILTLPLMPILSAILIVACNPWFGRYKYNGDQRLVKTDGQILTWLRLQALSMPITKKICTYLIRRDSNFGSWKAVFATYFQDPNHPNRNFADSAYER